MTDERKALYWLPSSGITAEKQNKLLEIFGSAIEIHKNVFSDLVKEYVGKPYAELSAMTENAIDTELKKLKADGIRLLLKGYDGYPKQLDQFEVVPPPVLYAKGNVELLNKPSICIVGTRKSTDYGKKVATQWSAELCEKFVIVSGHATGIDTYAVKSCLDNGGSAIIVLACGFEKFDFPTYLRDVDKERLLFITEYPMHMRVAKFSYQERNRLLSGLAQAVIVVEAPEKSGALITVDRAVQQNRQVFVVPGSVFSDRSKGTNKLIRDGATIATCATDVFEDLNVIVEKKITEKFIPKLSTEERAVYDFLVKGTRHFDEIVTALNLSPMETSAILSLMEIEGIIEKKPQNYFALSI
ncbi:MAG: DNA-processing protein DprA [Clostridia bacterium]|nr:DNA-processing protein DprA [Clostridia bacterium]